MDKFKKFNIVNDGKWVLCDYQRVDGETVWFCERNLVVHTNQTINGFGSIPEGITINYNDNNPDEIYSIEKQYVRK